MYVHTHLSQHVRIYKIPQHRLVNLRMHLAHISKARVYCSVLKCVTVPVLQCVAVCCSVLQCVVCCNATRAPQQSPYPI